MTSDHGETEPLTFRTVLGSLTVRELLGWDFLAALALTALIVGVNIAGQAPPAVFVKLSSDILQVAGAIFGIVLAAFGIAVALLGGALQRLLARASIGPERLLSGFLEVAVLLTASMTLAVIFMALHDWLARSFSEGLAVGVGPVVLLFFWALFAALEMVKLVLAIVVLTSRLGTSVGTDGGNAPG